MAGEGFALGKQKAYGGRSWYGASTTKECDLLYPTTEGLSFPMLYWDTNAQRYVQVRARVDFKDLVGVPLVVELPVAGGGTRFGEAQSIPDVSCRAPRSAFQGALGASASRSSNGHY